MFNITSQKDNKYIKDPQFHTIEETHQDRVSNTFSTSLPKPTQLNKKLRILDVGCSSGVTTYEIARLYNEFDIVGIDILSRRIKEAEILRIERIKDLKNNKLIKIDLRDKLIDILEEIEFLQQTEILNLNEKFSQIFYMNNIMFTLEKVKVDYFQDMIQSIDKHLEYGGFLLISGNTEFFILQKQKGKYITNKKYLQSPNRILVYNEILTQLNKISK